MAHKNFKVIVAGAAVLMAAGLASGASAQEQQCKPHEIDVGNGTRISAGCDKLKIALAMSGTNNVYLQASVKAAKDAAAAAGADIEVFDANWNPTTSFNQIENIIASGDYDAIVTSAYDGNQYCKQLTEDAPKANIIVVLVNSPGCGRSASEGQDLWSPGTLAFVGGTQSPGPYRDWLSDIATDNPGKHRVAVITGPEGISPSTNADLAVEHVRANYPEFEIVGVVRTDYTVLEGNEKFAPLLQANQDLDIVISNYSDVTRGVVQAIQQAGRGDDIKVYDFGGNSWAFEAVRRGQLESTLTMTPYSETYRAVEAVTKVWEGEELERVLPLPEALVLVSSENVDQLKPEF